MVPLMDSLTVLSMGSLTAPSRGFLMDSPMAPLTVLLRVGPSLDLSTVLLMVLLPGLAASGDYANDADDGGDDVSGDAASDGSA